MRCWQSSEGSLLGPSPPPDPDVPSACLVGAEAESAKIEQLLSELKGKDIAEVIAAGSKKLASVPSGGGGGAAAAPAAGGAAPAKKEEKKEEKEEEEEVVRTRSSGSSSSASGLGLCRLPRGAPPSCLPDARNSRVRRHPFLRSPGHGLQPVRCVARAVAALRWPLAADVRLASQTKRLASSRFYDVSPALPCLWLCQYSTLFNPRTYLP